MLGPDFLAPALVLGLALAVGQQLHPVLAARAGSLAIVGDASLSAGQQSDRQPVVVAEFLAHDSAAAHDRHPGAVQCPVERVEPKPVDAAGDRLVPGVGEALGAFRVEQPVGGSRGHADGARGAGDAAAQRQSVDEGALGVGSPAVAAFPEARDRVELDRAVGDLDEAGHRHVERERVAGGGALGIEERIEGAFVVHPRG